MNEQLTLTFEELDSITDALLIMKRQYPVSWSSNDEDALEKIKKAWEKAYEEKKGKTYHGEKESRP